uniref:Uncharacterized protein n=1 Tax=Chromera velia CCMP2878 TaxID=1169474 RepID=A0A0G4GY99_9ALVE|eukprot:Cvel_23896.t1-p1 / transcript=Cvel_23896.t1 / gene=Cvel_23896 / organism=Chromera_velia_CCMP2878 / gene_product=Ankyrin-1, putative / transcript_product=Ankyrin-1, putative / location=Cvel_scaffold2518:17694-23481(+) / protein_length=433 / sequence_SO=supercontig / SO=protein_coding / is_pseudo=false
MNLTLIMTKPSASVSSFPIMAPWKQNGETAGGMPPTSPRAFKHTAEGEAARFVPPTSPEAFTLTAMILKNLRPFKPVSPESLMAAIDSGDADELLNLLRLGADLHGLVDCWVPKSPSALGSPIFFHLGPIHLAARRGSEEAVDTLLRLGGRLEARAGNGWTPLHHAVSQIQNVHLPEKLLERGANIHAETKDGETVLVVAASSRWDNFVVVKSLLKKGASLNRGASLYPQMSALHCAAKRGHNKTLAVLADKFGEEVNATGQALKTPLHLAAENGHQGIVRWLVKEKGAAVEAQDEVGKTPLHLAAQAGHKQIVLELVREMGAQLMPRDKNGSTPLHVAAEWGRQDVVEALVKILGADIGVKALSGGGTALHSAAKWGHKDLIACLVKMGADVTVLDDDKKKSLDLWKSSLQSLRSCNKDVTALLESEDEASN